MPRGQKKAEKSKSKNVGYHFWPQRSMGPRRWRLRTFCKRYRIVSHIVYICGRSCPDISPSGKECFGAHLGAPQTANLGDGNGWVNQTIELRNDFGNPDVGACWESLVGGNHLRLWRQNGAKARTNALFLAYVDQQRGVFFCFSALTVCVVRGVSGPCV
jgi:hypothetical protein